MFSGSFIFAKKEPKTSNPKFDSTAQEVTTFTKYIIILCTDIINSIEFRHKTNLNYNIFNGFKKEIHLRKELLDNILIRRILTKLELEQTLYAIKEIFDFIPITSKQLAEKLPKNGFTNSLDTIYLEENIHSIRSDMILDLNLIINVGLIQTYKIKLQQLFSISKTTEPSLTENLQQIINELQQQKSAIISQFEDRPVLFATNYNPIEQFIGALNGIINDLRKGIPIDLEAVPKDLSPIRENIKLSLDKVLADIKVICVTPIRPC